jgi:N-acetylglucosaminyldiphosphoundecaprenol N-acetyl-beta-D-mannosaminyltransferase
MNKSYQAVRILGTRVQNTSEKETLDVLESALVENRQMAIFTPNTEMIMAAWKDQAFRDILNRAEWVIPDGIGLIHAARIQKKPIENRVTGFDTSVSLLEMAARLDKSVFFLGGAVGVAEQAAEEVLKTLPDLKIAGTHHGYFPGLHIGKGGSPEEKQVIEMINASGAEILFVGFGMKKQERWIDTYRDQLNPTILIGNGGTLDGLAGLVQRAPEIYQRLGLEWLYRLAKQPSRIGRQLVLPHFLWLALVKRGMVEIEEN